MRNVVSLQQPETGGEEISPLLTEALILAYSEGDDVLERTHSPKQLLSLEMSIAYDLTQLNWIDTGTVL